MADEIEIRTLGDFTVRWADTLIVGSETSHRRSIALLKALLRKPGYRCPAETMADELWPDSAGKAARTNLRVRLHELRGAFHPCAAKNDFRDPIRIEHGLLFIDTAYGPLLDAAEFERNALAALSAEPSATDIASYARLLDSYGGDYCQGDDDEQTVSIRERLARLHRAVLIRCADAYVTSGRIQQAVATLQAGFERYPYDETIAEKLIVRLVLVGHAAKARETYGVHAREFFRTTALRPSERLSGMLWDSVGPAEAFDVPRNSTFVGRAKERDALEDYVSCAAAQAGCAVSVVGSQGVGKSRLVAEVLHTARGRGIATGFVRCYRAPSAGMGSDPIAYAFERLLRSLLAGNAKTASGDTARQRLEAAAEDFFERTARAESADAHYAHFSQALRTITHGRPSILAIDDADLDERALSARVARLIVSTRDLPLLWVFVRRSRPHERAPRAESWQRIEVRPLPTEACATILERCFGMPVDPDSVVRFMRIWPGDLAVMLAAAERLRASIRPCGQVWRIPDDVDDRALVPETLATTIARHMESLPAPDLDVLRAAAFLDQNVSAALVARLLDIDEQQAEHSLRHLAAANLILEDSATPILPNAVVVMARAGITESRERALRRRLHNASSS